MAQVDAVFSKSRRGGHKEDVKTWGQLGLTGEWASRPISLYGRNSASGTYGFFKEHVLKNGDYKDEVKEQPGSAAVVQGVTVDRYAAGYSGIGYATAGVKAVPLSEKAGDHCHEATADEAYAGKYPLSRFLFVYINRAPGKPLDPLTREFAKLVLSREGQEVVVKDGYFPIPASIARDELGKIQ
jgi:phosphate transport system substrate-binding protein